MSRNFSLQILAALLFAVSFVTSTFASVVYVGTCKSGTHFSTIQDAVNHSGPGGTIDICPGTYPEQVSININLTLAGIPDGASSEVIIASPAGGVVQNATDLYDGSSIAAQVLIQGGARVNLTTLVVDGSNNQIAGCGPDFVGIYYQNSSGTVNGVVTRNQALTPDLGGCQSGLAIFVESGYSSGGTANVTIENSSVHDYQKNGITTDGSGTTAAITGNYIVGYGPSPIIAQNGIQMSDGATGSINNNDVVDDVYSPGTAGASGILVYDSGSLNIAGNTVSDTQYGIVIYSDGLINSDNNTITGNHVSATHLDDGIDLCSNGNTAKNNIVIASDGAGIHIDSTCSEGGNPTGNGTKVANNSVSEACAGVLTGSGSGNTFTPNTTVNVIDTTYSGDSCPSNGGGIVHRAKHLPSPHRLSH